MAEDIFGLNDTPPEELLGLVEQEPEQAEEPTVEEPEEATEETPSEPGPAERLRDEQGRFVAQEAPEVEAEAQEEPETEALEAEVEEEPLEETPEEEQVRLWANKYQTPDELEKGYNESREMWRRASEARKAEEQRAYEAEQREAELAKILTEAMPYLNAAAQREQQFHQFAEQYRQETGQYPQGYAGPPSNEPKALAPADVNNLVEQRLAQERQAMQAEFQRRQEFETTRDAVMGFYADHPEVEPRSPADNEITDTMQVLNEAWDARGIEVDMSDRGTIEVLYEASQRPALRQILALKPDYFDSDTGLNLARMEASVLEGAPTPFETQVTRTVPASQVGQTAGQRKPFAESAVTGAEAQEPEDENDPWTQIVREHKKGKSKASVFEFE